MDPDKLLEEIRDLLEPAKDDLCRSCLNHGVDLAEKFDNLDEWLSNGGFLPLEWAKGRK